MRIPIHRRQTHDAKRRARAPKCFFSHWKLYVQSAVYRTTRQLLQATDIGSHCCAFADKSSQEKRKTYIPLQHVVLSGTLEPLTLKCFSLQLKRLWALSYAGDCGLSTRVVPPIRRSITFRGHLPNRYGLVRNMPCKPWQRFLTSRRFFRRFLQHWRMGLSRSYCENM